MYIKRNLYAIRLQVVYAIAHDVTSILPEEIAIIEEAFRSGARNLKCDIISTSCGDRWFASILTVDAAFDIPKAMTSLKAVTARAMNTKRESNTAFWLPGYMVSSIGELVDPEEIALKLAGKRNRK